MNVNPKLPHTNKPIIPHNQPNARNTASSSVPSNSVTNGNHVHVVSNQNSGSVLFGAGVNTQISGATVAHQLKDGLVQHANTNCTIVRLFVSNDQSSDKQLHISQSYVNLSIISNPDDKEKKEQQDQAKQMYDPNQHERQQSYESLYKTKTPVEIEKIFDNSAHRRQLIIGAPGVGKSTLCQYIFYRCNQENGLWSDKFDAVFWIPLRKLKGVGLLNNMQKLLAFIVCNYGLSGASRDSINMGELKNFVAKNGNRILWILDGYDEVITEANQQGSLIKEFLARLDSNGSAIIMTSRPQPQYLVDGKSLSFDCTMENIGFTGINSATDECLAVLKQNPAIWGSVHIPIILEIICSIWSTTPQEELVKVNSLPVLYQLIVDNLWLRHLRKTNPNIRREDISSSTNALADDLSCLASSGFIRNEIILSSATLREVYRNRRHSQISFSDWCNLLEQSGFVRPIVGGNKQDTQYYFIHLSFQEYFAGRFYAQEFIVKSVEVREFFAKHQYSQAHRLMWQFTIGALYQHYKTTNDALPLLSYWEVVLNSMDMEGKDYFALVMDGLESCGVDRSFAIHQRLFEQIQGILFTDRYNELLRTKLSVLKMCLLNIPAEITKKDLISLRSLLQYLPNKIELPSDSRVITTLLSWMGDEDWDVQMSACVALGQISAQGDRRVIDVLLGMLGHSNSEVRSSAGDALVKISAQGDRRVIDALVGWMGDNDRYLISNTCVALGKISAQGDQRVITTLLGRVGDKDWHVRIYACDALVKISAKGDRLVIDALLGRMGGSDWEVRIHARGALVKISAQGDRRVIDALLGWMGDKNQHVRSSACYALGEISAQGDRRVIDALVGWMGDSDPLVRFSACDALGKISTKGDQRVIDALLGRVGDKDWHVRSSACYALGQISAQGDRRVIDALLGWMGDNDEYVRRSACEALVKISAKGDHRVIDALVGWMWYLYPDVRSNACVALVKISAQGDQRFIDALLGWMGDSDKYVRKSACDTLGKIFTKGDQRVIDALLGRVGDSDKYVRIYACDTLGKISTKGDQRVIDALLGRVGDSDKYVRRYACIALGQISAKGDRRVIDQLLGWIGDNDEHVRISACKALGKISAQGDQRVIDALLGRMGDKSHHVRSFACEALKSILPPVFKDNLGKLLHYTKEIFDHDLINVIIHNKGLDICCGTEKVTLDKQNPQYANWLDAIKKYALDKKLPLVNEMIEAGYNPALVSLPQKQPELLQQAVLSNNQELLTQILGQSPEHLYSRNADGSTLLHLAVGSGNFAIARILIKNGAEINVFDSQGYSPLYIVIEQLNKSAVYVDSYEGVRQKLVNATQNRVISTYQPQNNQDYPHLINAVSQDSKKQVKYLLSQRSVDINHKNPIDGRTPLMLAVIERCSSVVHKLIKSGANVSLTDSNGKTALQLCEERLQIAQRNANNPQELLDMASNLIGHSRLDKASLDRLLSNLYLAADNEAITNMVSQWLGMPSLVSNYINTGYRDIYRSHRNNFLEIILETTEIQNGRIKQKSIKPDGNDFDIFIGFRIRLYVEILLRLEKNLFLQSDLLEGMNLRETITQLKSEILINAQLWFNEKIRGSYVNLNNDGQKQLLKQTHANTIIEHLKSLPEGSEYYLQSGYSLITGEGHCVYVAFCKQANNKILIRLDNRWIQAGRIDEQRHETNKIDGRDVIRPYCVGVISDTDNNLKAYVVGVIDAMLESSNANNAMNKIYDSNNLIPRPQILDFTNDWPYQDKQPGNANNCTMSSHNFGVMCRRGKVFAKWLMDKENSLIWQEGNKNRNTTSPKVTLSKPMAGKVSQTDTSGNQGSVNNQSKSRITTTTITNSNLSPQATGSSVATGIKLPSHEQLMRHLATTLGVDYSEVYNGSVVEQRLVALAGINTSQSNAQYRRQADGNTYFLLRFVNIDEYNQLIAYYQQNFPRFIVNTSNGYNANGLTKFVVNTMILYENVANRLLAKLEDNNIVDNNGEWCILS